MTTKPLNDSDIDRKLGTFYTSFGASTATNSILRWMLILFGLLAFTEGAMLLRQSSIIANQRPLIVRVDSVGKAVPVGYEWDFKPQANEVKFFVTQFSQLFFSRSHNPKLPEIYAQSYYFLSPDYFHKVSAYDEQTHWLAKYLSGSDPDVKVHVDNILVRNLDHAPYEVTMQLTEQFLGASGTPVKPDEKHEATIHFSFAQRVPNEMVLINPLGILINDVQDDRRFTN
jgi:type IV secretory pathway TrbF-like protein